MPQSTILYQSRQRTYGCIRNFLVLGFAVFAEHLYEAKSKTLDSTEGKLEWIEDSRLSSLNLWESDHIFFPWIERGEFFSAKFEYEGDKMRGYDVISHKSY